VKNVRPRRLGLTPVSRGEQRHPGALRLSHNGDDTFQIGGQLEAGFEKLGGAACLLGSELRAAQGSHVGRHVADADDFLLGGKGKSSERGQEVSARHWRV
jgi:hypothetical protein